MGNLQRRGSRTDLDFENLLKSEGTVVLKEGLDVNTLGVEQSPSPSSSSYYSPVSTPTVSSKQQPSTPTVVPPTPASAPLGGPSSPKPPKPPMHDPFSDTEDAERTINRRSMYRSPGTSSSPDLATLLRKAREKGEKVGMINARDRRRESPPPLPSLNDRTANGLTSPLPHYPTTPQGSPLPRGKNRSQRMQQPNTSEWVLAGLQNGSPTKPTKSSVRSKASTFLGKMLGQNTVRERSKTDASDYNSNALSDAFAPPVPPLPPGFYNSPLGSPIADVYSSSPSATPLPPASTSKPLPPIRQTSAPAEMDDADERSMVFVEKLPVTPTPESRKARENLTVKRRSMSVSDAELQRVMSASAAAAVSGLPKTPEVSRKQEQEAVGPGDTTLDGILNDFKGELSQLDPTSTSRLELHDPSTPSRRAAYARSKTDSLVLSSGQGSESKRLSTPSSAMPTLTLSETNVENTATEPSPIVPPRSTSLNSTPARSSSGTSATSSRLSPIRSRSGNSFALPPPSSSRGLRVLHRSTASSSEPSLIPAEESRLLTRAPTASHQDLRVTDLARFPPRSPKVDDTDLDTRGQDAANKCWNEDEEFLARDKIAEWLGGTGEVNKIGLQYYMDFFDFSGLRLDMAFRRLCSKLYLKGETQQVDRILETFSRRYWECNPGGVYGSANIVHAVSYSLLLLNTDLHVADLTTRMSRNQFVRNTLTAIQTQLQPSPLTQTTASDTQDDASSVHAQSSDGTETARSKRSDSITSWNSISRDTLLSSPALSFATTQVTTPGGMSNDSSPSMQLDKSANSTSFYGRNWEINMESLLKEMYNAIKNQQILQPLGASRSSMSSLSPGSNVLRNRSLRGQPDRLTTLKRGSIRGIQSIMGVQGHSPYSSNSSIDGRVSPSPSFATSLHELNGTSSSFLSPTLGFASNLSHTIIRETQEDDDRSIHSTASTNTSISITDEELALLGAPWAKEGMLCRKQYWESQGKRAKDKAWMDVFVVIQKGKLDMFTFGEGGSGSSSVVGGGNWLSNATPVGTVQLSHSLAHALPSPGYSRQRPYCMVLTLSNGGVYFFQAGTEELVNEWVSTCNYWAARTSKEPLAGGVSNMEYGWNRVLDPVHGRSVSDSESMRDDATSIRSARSNRSKFGWKDGAATVRAGSSPWSDRININDWKPPMHPTVASMHDEETQLEALKKHVKAMKRDLQRHNELREPMASLYQPRTNNAIKAQSNWEKKSQWLLTEIVKYDSYIDSLQAAMSLRLRKRGEKALEKALNGNSDDVTSAKWKGKGPQETIHEDEEPLTPNLTLESASRLHKRETAEDDGVEDDD
ncbi:hypothetical protein K435DRAFT_713604 [Dendrothele bispora CBS 962.96]|uniref:SEC7 domain-containing protein n=1 Tax=Dendrothele bispora (strain CBS 962.96) TaxID=1314807 RepID=A0A4S8MR28_DENBC|nr:hypothetical protein K435DRAFT_713604 [Dendrothele bispora CBS 962.96]